MTLQETIDLVRDFLAYDLDGYDENSTAATVAGRTKAINWAIRTVARRAELFSPTIPITLVAGQAVYDLRTMASDGKRIIKPRQVIIDGAPLMDCANQAYGVWSLAELERNYPRWRTAPSGTPTKAVWVGQQLILHSPPDADTVAEGGNYIEGSYLPPDMSHTTGLSLQLPLPVEVHEAVAYCAAVKLATPTVSEQMGMARLQAFSAEWVAAIDELKRETASTLTSWGSTTGSEGGDWLCL